MCSYETITTGYLRETEDTATAQGRGPAGYSLLPGGFSCRARDASKFGLGKGGWVKSLALLFSWLSEGREAAVSVGKIHHHCRVLPPAAFLLP